MRQSAIRALNSARQRDFFGIHDVTNKDIAGAFATKTKLPALEIEKKYDPLLKSRNRLVNEEKDTDVVFGRIRYDSENVTKKHGQFEEDATARLYDTIQVKQMFVPDEEPISDRSRERNKDAATSQPEDSQYGVPFKISEIRPVQEINDILMLFRSPEDDKRLATLYKNQPPITFHFDGASDTISPETSQKEHHPHNKENEGSNQELASTNRNTSPEFDLRRPQLDIDKQAGPYGAIAPMHELDVVSQEYQERQDELNIHQDRFDRSLDKKYDVADPEKPIKAIQYLRKVRSKEIEPTAPKLKDRLATIERPYSFKPLMKLDSKGLRIYTHQVPDWTSVRKVDKLSYIRGSIIYHNYDILAVNKPYGLASHSSPSDCDGSDLNSLMREVAKSMRVKDIYLAHRLDKTTTGVLLFATSKERAQNLNKLFKADEIKKAYWCITNGIPDPAAGIIDLPIGNFEVAGKIRSCPAPVYLNEDKQLAKKYREARRAVTQYRVIDSKAHVALLELKPQSGVKHQLRCHMGFGLKTPILGDHKYSNLEKLAPQKLAPSVLNALHLRQAKVRTLPIHLHAKSIVIPGAKADGETLFINAPLPRHFVDNMKTLKLSCRDE